jgi:hypothetical protein
LNGESILEAERPEDALLLDSRPVAIGRESCAEALHSRR